MIKDATKVFNECDSCTYRTKQLHKVDPPFMGKRKEPYYFCELCYSSYAGNAAQYPGQYAQTGDVMRHMCLMTNFILEALKEKK